MGQRGDDQEIQASPKKMSRGEIGPIWRKCDGLMDCALVGGKCVPTYGGNRVRSGYLLLPTLHTDILEARAILTQNIFPKIWAQRKRPDQPTNSQTPRKKYISRCFQTGQFRLLDLLAG